MKNTFTLFTAATAFVGLGLLLASCEKDKVSPVVTPETPAQTASFVEQFNNVGELSTRGWVFKNNSNPIGQSGWRQGRYEAAPSAKFPEPMIGFQAYNSLNSPNDFVSCDASAVNYAGNISSWLISPQLPMKNGDQIIFYTRAINDANYPIYVKDRMQVRANFTNGDLNVGTSSTDTGSYRLLLDINPSYLRNDPGGNAGAGPGYPMAWAKYTITISGLTSPVQNARFAFRYLGTDAGVNGGSAGANYAGVVGVDSLAFVRQ